MLALKFALVTIWMVPLRSGPKDMGVQDFQRQSEMWTRQTAAYFSTLLQSISDELRSTEVVDFLEIVDIWLPA